MKQTIKSIMRHRVATFVGMIGIVCGSGVAACGDETSNANNSNSSPNNVNIVNSMTNNTNNATNNTNNATNNTNSATNNTNNTNNTNSATNNTNNMTIVGTVTNVVPVTEAETDEFATSTVCADCHANDNISPVMQDAAGRSVAFNDLWASTMKANAARDPFFLAVLSAETSKHPTLASEIEHECMECHTPMAVHDAELAEEELRYVEMTIPSTRASLGADGVSCVACHAITDEGFGSEDSFSGGGVYSTDGVLFGPHADPLEQPMLMNTNYAPVQSDHISESAHCGTCHTLFTHTILDDHTLDEDSNFPEQVPYLEWRNSAYNDEIETPGPDAASCQDCHMPKTDVDGNVISTELAHRPNGGSFPPATDRGLSRHVLVGGNTLIPQILKAERAILQPLASDAAFDATIAATRDQLQNRTATLSIQNAVKTVDSVSFDVEITNLTGHKLPSAYPSRRAWLHVTVKDAQGNVLTETGAWDTYGSLLDAQGAVLPSELAGGPIEPHRNVVTSPDDVQIYQSVVGNSDGEATVHILSAAGYLKDNRLLPKGWVSSHADAAATAPIGVTGDSNFASGSDAVRFQLPVSGDAASVEVEFVYQVLGARWASELFLTPTADVQRFREMLERFGGLTTERIAMQTATF